MQIGSLNEPSAVREQYATADGLNTRISFHGKYSTNLQGFGNWVVSHYDVRDGMRVLELGCGSGGMWAGRDELISRCGELVLTDLSEGMLETARKAIGERANVAYRQADIQALPFADGSFDAVIANSMLYHVPDLSAGVAEVRRVLKPDGTFYCATYGEHNFTEQLAEWFRLGGEAFRPNHNFTLENGVQALSRSFRDIELLRYEDSLRITDAEDLLLYLQSLAPLRAVNSLPREKILDILNSHTENGVICLPKSYGMFIAKGTA
ncbi:MAG: class I SAM-dependent methyltransferase [Ruminococcaceae bacterium]|nr:class I SAM-dependent methyltransferase [Oscillospiraceae bacterium]